MIIFCIVILCLEIANNFARLRTILFSKSFNPIQGSSLFTARLILLVVECFILHLLITNYARL